MSFFRHSKNTNQEVKYWEDEKWERTVRRLQTFDILDIFGPHTREGEREIESYKWAINEAFQCARAVHDARLIRLITSLIAAEPKSSVILLSICLSIGQQAQSIITVLLLCLQVAQEASGSAGDLSFGHLHG